MRIATFLVVVALCAAFAFAATETAERNSVEGRSVAAITQKADIAEKNAAAADERAKAARQEAERKAAQAKTGTAAEAIRKAQEEAQCLRYTERIRTLEQENERLKAALSKYERAAGSNADAGRAEDVRKAEVVATTTAIRQNARPVAVTDAYQRAISILDRILGKAQEKP